MVAGSCGCHSSNSLGTGQAGARGTSSPSIGLNMWLGGPGGREPWDGKIMAEQQFCLRWNNFQSNIVSSFEALLDREEFVDVTLTAEGKCLKAHRILLSACSPYFRDLFRELPSHQHPIIVLRDTCFQELKSLLNFIYHGEVNVSQERLGLLLKLAEALRIKGLAQDNKSRENKEQFGNQSVSPEKEPEEGLDRGRSGGPGSPALSLVGFPGVTGLPSGNPLVPLEPPSHKPQLPHMLHSSPPAKRRKPIHSPLAGPILLPLSTPQREMLNSHQTLPISNANSQQDDESSTPRVINLTMGNNGGPSPPPKISVVPKTELQEDVEGAQEREIGRIGCSLGGNGSGVMEGSSDHEDDLKEEEDMDNECHLNTNHPHDLSGLPPHLTAAVQNFVPYAAAAAAAAGSSHLDNYPGPSGVMPPASQPGWRGGPHSEPTDTSAQDSPGPLSSLQSSHMSLFFPPRTWSAATAGLRPQMPLPSLAPLTFPPSNGSAAAAAIGQAQFSPMRPRILRPSHRPAHCPACGRYFTFGHNMKAHLKRCPKNPHRPPSCNSNTTVSTSTGEYLDCGSEYEDKYEDKYEDNNTSPSMSPTSLLAEQLSEVVEAASGVTVGLTGGSISLANAVKSLCPAVVCSPSALKQEQQ